MKKLLLLIICLPFFSCGEKQEQEQAYSLEERQQIDSIKAVLLKETEQKIIEDSKVSDTIGIYTSPIQVTSSRIIDSESGNYRNVQLTYKNVSDKPISAMKFRWKGKNAFSEPADLGNLYLKGYGGGFDDDALQPGKSRTSTWSILSNDAKTVEAWPIEVVLADNSKWLQEDYQ